MSSRKNIRVSVTVAAMLCLGVSAYGTVWHVHPDSAISSIQAGIDFSSEGDTILVYPETYYENINLGRKNIVLASLFLTTADTSYIRSTVIDGDSSGNVLVLGYQQDSTTVISGFTIQNGYGMSGCGIDCLAMNPTISHCIIRDNSGVRDGSGIRCGGGSPIITHCTIIRNGLGATMYAAGIWCHSLSDPIISDCTIKENGNAQCLGGGIECLYSNPSLTNLVITGNAAYEGGGILCYLSNPTLTNVTISDNIGYHSGGGIQCWESSNPVLVNTILWNNEPQEIHVHSGSAIATYSDIQGGWPGEGNIDVDPLFADADHGIYEVFSGSPCIDAGDPGILDPDGTRSDIGVFYPEHPDSLIRIVAPDAATDEGEELICNVSAVDLGGGSIDSIRVIAGLPEDAAFEDLGGGEASVVWYPWFCSAPDSYTVMFKVWDNEGDWNVRGTTIRAGDVNRPPVIVCPEPVEVDECAPCTLVVLCSDPDSCDADLVRQEYSDVPEEYVTADWTGGDWANPNVDTLILHFGYDFTCCHDSTVRIRFISTDNHGSQQWMAPPLDSGCWTEITVHDVPRPPTLTEQPEPYYIEKGDTCFFTVGYTDPDLCDTVPTHMTFSYEDSDIAGLDYEAGIDASTGVFWFYAGPHFVPPRAHDMSFTITFTVTDHTDLSDSETYTFIIDEPGFTLQVKKVFAWPGQQHVRVPVFLSNPWDEVGGWNVLMEYDNTGGQVVGIELCDSALVDDPAHGGPRYFYAPWYYDPGLRPEYFTYNLGVHGHESYVRVIGIQNMPWPQEYVPDIPRDEQMLLFCFVYDVSPLWSGREIMFKFHTKDCGDNVLSSSDGYTVWGPDDESGQNAFACPDRPLDLRLVRLIGGAGIGIRTVTVGDINLNGIAYEIGDAILFVNYLMHGPSVLLEPELQTSNSDVNGDGVFWSIADLVMLLNLINETEAKATAPGKALVKVSGEAVELTTESEVGGAYFVLKCEGEIGKPELMVDGMDIAWTAEGNVLKVLVYSMESKRIPEGTHTLFTVPGAGKFVLEKVEIANAGGVQAEVRIAELPKKFALYQNRPNPVRTTAEIAYSIPVDSKVSLKVYDAAGMLVETLVDGWQEAGVYRAVWDAKGIASGVYFYKLEAGKLDATRKLILMR